MPKFSKPNNCLTCKYRSKYLQVLKDNDIEQLKDNCMTVRFKKGEVISKQGAEVTHALYLADGLVKLCIDGGSKNIILKLMKSGNYIGLQTLFSKKKHGYSVIAAEESIVCMISQDYFMGLAESNASFLLEITRAISFSADCAVDKIIDINQKQLKGRLAATLIYLANEIYEDTSFDLTLTRKELAELSAMSTENAVRLLSEMKKDGIIETSGKRLTITHIDMLHKISELA